MHFKQHSKGSAAPSLTFRQTSKFERIVTRRAALIAPKLVLIASGFHFAMTSQFAHAQSTDANDTDFDTAFRTVKRNDSLQFDFTTAPTLPQSETPQWMEAIGWFFVGIFDFIGGILSLFTPIFYIAFWLGVGLFAMAVIYLIATTLMAAKLERRDKTTEETLTPLYQPEQAQARILLAEIDALAAQGKYAEAVHTLLFRSIQDIDTNRPNVIRRSLTSREIGSLTILTQAARDVFARIASVVERSFFGGQEIGKGDFDNARADYVQLAGQSGQWASDRPNTSGVAGAAS